MNLLNLASVRPLSKRDRPEGRGAYRPIALATFAAVLSGGLLMAREVRADDCRTVTVLSPAPMLGNNDEVLKLSDGTNWRVRYEFAFLFKSFPSARICPNAGTLTVAGKSLRVERLYRDEGEGTRPEDPDRPSRSAERLQVIIADDDCGRFLAFNDRRYYAMDWIQGPFPRDDDQLILETQGERSANARYRLDGRSGWASLVFAGTDRREALRAFSRRCGP